MLCRSAGRSCRSASTKRSRAAWCCGARHRAFSAISASLCSAVCRLDHASWSGSLSGVGSIASASRASAAAARSATPMDNSDASMGAVSMGRVQGRAPGGPRARRDRPSTPWRARRRTPRAGRETLADGRVGRARPAPLRARRRRSPAARPSGRPGGRAAGWAGWGGPRAPGSGLPGPGPPAARLRGADAHAVATSATTGRTPRFLSRRRSAGRGRLSAARPDGGGADRRARVAEKAMRRSATSASLKAASDGPRGPEASHEDDTDEPRRRLAHARLPMAAGRPENVPLQGRGADVPEHGPAHLQRRVANFELAVAHAVHDDGQPRAAARAEGGAEAGDDERQARERPGAYAEVVVLARLLEQPLHLVPALVDFASAVPQEAFELLAPRPGGSWCPWPRDRPRCRQSSPRGAARRAGTEAALEAAEAERDDEAAGSFPLRPANGASARGRRWRLCSPSFRAGLWGRRGRPSPLVGIFEISAG